MTTYNNFYPLPDPLFGGWSISFGVSEEADTVLKKNNETRESQLFPSQDSQLARAYDSRLELDKIIGECSDTDWNGTDALPIPVEAADQAEQIIAQIPIKYPIPEINAEPTGDISLEFFVDPYCVLLLSIPGDGFLYFSGLFGYKNTDHGSKPINGQLDEKILLLLEEVYKYSDFA